MVKYTWTISDNGQIEFGNLQRSQKLKFVWLYVIQLRISLKCLTTILTNNNCSETLKVPPDQGYSDFLSTNFVRLLVFFCIMSSASRVPRSSSIPADDDIAAMLAGVTLSEDESTTFGPSRPSPSHW